MDSRSQNLHSVLGITRHKTACEYCGKPRAAARALKRCKGCTVTWYCNKQCQTKAWYHHNPSVLQKLGCAIMAEISHMSKQWAEAHQLTLFIMATVLAELRGGGAHAVLGAPQSVIFDLGPPRSYPGSTGAGDGSPATAFTLVRASLEPQANLGGASAAQWAPPAMALRTNLARKLSAAGARPDIVGLLPATFYVPDAQLAAQSNLPLHRASLRHRSRVRARGGTVDERTKRVLYSLLGVCMGVINTGTVLRIPADAEQVVPDLGRFVRRRTRKGWQWAPLALDDSEECDSEAQIASEEVAKEFFGSREFELAPIPPLDSFKTYHSIWSYHSLCIGADR
ncbi:hypothetical protein V8D89_005349 [Ganoderma adspersum]